MLVKQPASCFIDCLEIGMGANAQTLARDYLDVIGEDPDIDPATEGYHPSIVNQCLLERFGTGLSEIDLMPVGEDGESMGAEITRYITAWFKRPGFQCVVTGPRNTNGEEHANAFVNGSFFDSSGDALDEPNIQLRTVWVLGIPTLETGLAGYEPDEDEGESC